MCTYLTRVFFLGFRLIGARNIIIFRPNCASCTMGSYAFSLASGLYVKLLVFGHTCAHAWRALMPCLCNLHGQTDGQTEGDA